MVRSQADVVSLSECHPGKLYGLAGTTAIHKYHISLELWL